METHHKFQVYENEDIILARLDTCFDMLSEIINSYHECEEPVPIDLNLAFNQVFKAILLYQNYTLLLKEGENGSN